MVKNAFYFMLNFLFLEIFTFLFLPFGYFEKCIDTRAKVNFKIHDVTDWTKNIYNIHIALHLKK